jgi:hypothetical protein
MQQARNWTILQICTISTLSLCVSQAPLSTEHEAIRGRPAEHGATGWSMKEQYLPALEEED